MHIPKSKILSKGGDITKAIVLSCSKSPIGAHCEFPLGSKFGFYSFYIGDTFINTTFISNELDSSTITATGNINEEKTTMTIILSSNDYYLNSTNGITVNGEKITSGFNINKEFNIISFSIKYDSEKENQLLIKDSNTKIVRIDVSSVNIEVERNYLSLMFGAKVVISGNTNSDKAIDKIYINDVDDVVIGSDFIGKFEYTFTLSGVYQINYQIKNEKTIQPTDIFIYVYSNIDDLKASLLTFRSPPTCCYKDKTHQISLSQNENFTSTVYLERLKASIIRTKDDGMIETYDLGRVENTFTIEQSMLEELDTEQYHLVIVEGNDYNQPLYSQIVQFSKLSILKSYYYDSIDLSVTCLYPNIKMQTSNEDISEATPLTCSYSNPNARCSLPDSLSYGNNMIVVGDTKISETFISSSISKSHFIFSGI